MKYIIIIVALFLVYKLLPVIFREAGRTAGYAGDFKKALSRLKIATKLSPKAKNKSLYGYMLMQNESFREAICVFNEIVLDRSVKAVDKVTAKVYRTMARVKLGEMEDALEDAEEIFASMKNTLTYSLLGYVRQSCGNAALDLCLEAYDYNCDERDICDNLAVAYYMTGDLESAAKTAEQVREKFPAFLEGFYHSALIAAKMGDKESALKYLDEIPNCRRTAMTTVSQKAIEDLKEELKNA